MSRFQKAMVWLGLTDAIEEDDEFDDRTEEPQRRARHYRADDEVVDQMRPSRVQVYQNVQETKRGSRDNIRHLSGEMVQPSSSGRLNEFKVHDYTDSALTAEPAQRTGFVKPMPAEKPKLHLSQPQRFSDVQEIGDRFKEKQVVLVDLDTASKELARRVIDFCSGATYALDGKIEKLSEDLLLLSPENIELSSNDREKLMDRLRPRTED